MERRNELQLHRAVISCPISTQNIFKVENFVQLLLKEYYNLPTRLQLKFV